MRRWRKRSLLRHSTPTLKLLLLSSGALGLSVMLKLIEVSFNTLFEAIGLLKQIDCSWYTYSLLFFSASIAIIAIVERLVRSTERQIKYMVIKRLCNYKYGNPLHLNEGELEPQVEVQKTERGYRVRVKCSSAEFDKVAALENVISDCLVGKLSGYAVVDKDEDVANRYVDYYIDDEAKNAESQSIYNSLEDMRR